MDHILNENERLKKENAILKEELLRARQALDDKKEGPGDDTLRRFLKTISDRSSSALIADFSLSCKDEIVLFIDKRSLDIKEPLYSPCDLSGKFSIRLSSEDREDILTCSGVYVDEEFAARENEMPSAFAGDESADAGRAFLALEKNPGYIMYEDDPSASENSGSIYIDSIHVAGGYPSRSIILYFLRHLPGFFEIKYQIYLRYACVDISPEQREVFKEAGFTETAPFGAMLTCIRYYTEEDHRKAIEE